MAHDKVKKDVKLSITFHDQITGRQVTTEPLLLCVNAALWSFLSERDRKEYCFNAFLNAVDINYLDVKRVKRGTPGKGKFLFSKTDERKEIDP